MNTYILNDNIQTFWCLKIKIMKLIRISFEKQNKLTQLSHETNF